MQYQTLLSCSVNDQCSDLKGFACSVDVFTNNIPASLSNHIRCNLNCNTRTIYTIITLCRGACMCDIPVAVLVESPKLV